MSKSKYDITKEGLEKFKEELEYLKSVKRKENIRALQEARAQGDLSENAEYDAARDEQAQIEARITELENIIKNSRIIETDNSDAVSIGKTVEFIVLPDGEIQRYTIVGSEEANPFEDKISISSPVAQALKGKHKDDVVDIILPAGSYKVKILDVKTE
ncbi:MAG: transcription elongation factor GreA [Bacilli bacterium]|nr:transcription elongation factor GreA [Bacilli bacterium]